MNQLIKVSINDFKLIFRDPSLRAFLLLPVALYAVVLFLLPFIMDKYEFLTPYLSLFIAVAVIENTQMFSFISSMIWIEEKETDVAKVYGILPVSKTTFMLFRLLIPYLITTLLNLVLLLIQPFFNLPLDKIIGISMLAALIVPIYALGINSLVKNRMEGMVYVKVFNLIVLLPLIAFFIPDSFQHLLGIFPTYWLFQGIDKVIAQESCETFFGIGYAFSIALSWWLVNRVVKKHFS